MSAYIVDNKTISALVKGFIEYGVDYHDGRYEGDRFLIDLSEERIRIGQSLLNQNYASVNYRYSENEEPETFEFEDVDIDEGIIFGCIACYNYQACETEDYFKSQIYHSTQNLRDKLLDRLLRKAGMKAPYGYDGFDILED